MIDEKRFGWEGFANAIIGEWWPTEQIGVCQDNAKPDYEKLGRLLTHVKRGDAGELMTPRDTGD